MDMTEPVNFFAGDMRCGCCQIIMKRVLGKIVGNSHAIDGRPDHGMIHVRNPFSHYINGQIQLPNTVKIFFLSFQRHKINLFSLL
jgi:hypothetical protein